MHLTRVTFALCRYYYKTEGMVKFSAISIHQFPLQYFGIVAPNDGISDTPSKTFKDLSA